MQESQRYLYSSSDLFSSKMCEFDSIFSFYYEIKIIALLHAMRMEISYVQRLAQIN